MSAVEVIIYLAAGAAIGYVGEMRGWPLWLILLIAGVVGISLGVLVPVIIS